MMSLLTPSFVKKVLAIGAMLFPWGGEAAQQSFPHTKIEFLTNAKSVEVGKPFWVGLYFRLESGWHIYWKNPGDSGNAMAADFKGSDPSVKVGPVSWPTPKRIPVAHLANYGYEGEVLLPMQVTWVQGAKPSEKKNKITGHRRLARLSQRMCAGNGRLSKRNSGFRRRGFGSDA
jgi:DsbC/DsbD-like thiol-disulfide interchange protein